jgi:hypothetical protein
VSGRLSAHLLATLCWCSVAIGCSGSGPANSNGSQSTSRATGGGRSNGETTGAPGGSVSTGGSGGNTTGGGQGSTGTSGGHVGCDGPCTLPGMFCDDDAGKCVVCLADDQCVFSTAQPHCFLGAGADFGTCVECGVPSDCPLGEICDSEKNCIPGCGQAMPCSGEAPICEGDSGMCVTCLSAAQCTNGLVCSGGQCTLCTSDFQCYQNYPNVNLWVCSPEENCVQCRMDSDCPNGEHCVGTGCK